MTELKHSSVTALRPGDLLGQDVMSGDTVWLRSGTVLNETQIERIQRMGIARLLLLAPDLPPAVAAPDFTNLAGGDQPRWMADASFAQAVELPAPASPEEETFARQKLELRTGAGLQPLLDPGVEAELSKSLQTAFISAASSGRVDLNKVDEIARTLAASIPANNENYFFFTDIARYGQHLIARSIMSSKIYVFARPDDAQNGVEDHLRAHLALQSAFALLPAELSKPVDTQTNDERVQLRTALIQYFNWLKDQDYVAPDVLEEVVQQFERYDGSGAPFGLSGEQIGLGGQTWALSIAYSERVFSRPRRYRLSPHQAADELVRQSGSAFSGSAVNRFLRLMGFFPNGSMVELNDGRMAIVLRQNERGLLKPVVRISDAEGLELDLKANPTVFIKRQILEY